MHSLSPQPSPISHHGAVALRQHPLWGLLAGGLTTVFWVLSLPPFEFAEAAYIAFVPLLLWLYTQPGRRDFWLITLGSNWCSWFLIFIWLRHVTWGGTIALAAVLALITSLWLLLVRRVLPRIANAGFAKRMLCFAGLAGAWVVLEWTRTWLFWGFPWGPYSLSQWERPVVLQIAAWTGAYGVSFLLIFFNFCVAHTLRSRVIQKERKLWTGWFSPDLYMGMAALGFCFYLFFHSLPPANSLQELFKAGVVQPYIPPDLKWDAERELENLEILEQQTRFVATLENDVILWPEAATPWPIVGLKEMQVRVEELVDEIEQPILMGNLSADFENDIWRNGVCLVLPQSGLQPEFYSKRELVPFGEFVPPLFQFIEKFVPVGGNFMPGTGPELIELKLAERSVQIGSLVCYEDAFPALARASTREGAEVLFVATNNAWYGEEGGAAQHAAHSVLRAVENRRPVMRAGNGGWSGWIDAYGTIRDVLVDAEGSVYFRGGGSYEVFQFKNWQRQQSFYTRHGDWFVVLCAALAALTLFVRLKPC